MPISQWFIGLVIAVTLVDLLITYAIYRYGPEPSELSPARSSRASSHLGGADIDAVSCPDCGAENEPVYRYCRSCVTTLPGAMSFDRGGDDRLGQLLR